LFSAACKETATNPAAAAINHFSFISKTPRCDARKIHLLAFIGHVKRPSETPLIHPFQECRPEVKPNLMLAAIRNCCANSNRHFKHHNTPCKSLIKKHICNHQKQYQIAHQQAHMRQRLIPQQTICSKINS